MLNGGLGRGPGAAIKAGDQDDIGVGLGHPGGDGAHPHLRHQLDVNAGLPVSILEVVDQLRQVFDGVNIVVGGRGDQAHPGGGVAHLGNPGVDLAAGQLAPFAGFCPLGHFDLQFLSLGEVEAGHPKPARGHLLDGAVFRVALVIGPGVAFRVFPPFAGVGPTADAVHGDGQGLMGLLGDRTVAHRPGLKPAGDRLHRLHLL